MRVAVAGAGYWGKNLVRNFAALGHLGAICESHRESRDFMAAKYPAIPTFASLDEVLTDPAINAVAIATPAATHGTLARMALHFGKHVFVEKPLCLDMHEARQLAALAISKKRILMVGHMLLYHPAFVALKSAVDEGRIGRLRYIYSTRLSLGKIRREENALWSFAPHDISMILSLTKCMPTRIISSGSAFLSPGIADTTLSHLSFAEDLQAHIFVSWLHPYKDQRLVVVGSAGMIVFDDVAQGDRKLLLYRHAVSWDGDLPSVNRAEAEPIAFGDEEPLLAECRHFRDCVKQQRAPTSDAAEGIRVLEVLDACQKSLNANLPVQLGNNAAMAHAVGLTAPTT